MIMKPKLLPLLERCIEDGVTRGYNRSYKHTDEPSDVYMQQMIISCVMEEIHEWFDFDEIYYDEKN